MSPEARKSADTPDVYQQKCDALMDFVVKINDEDVVAIEGLQRGLNNARKYDLHGEFLPKYDWTVHRFQNMVLNGIHGQPVNDNLTPDLCDEFEQRVRASSA